jgi:ubiquinone/menaquinone biosynthesis C-methylase UbiE
VLCVDTLSYVFDVQKAFHEMVRVLRPGGILIVIEPNTREEDATAFWGFRVSALNQLAEVNDLTIHELETAGKLLSGEVDNFKGFTKYSFLLPDEFDGWADALDNKYPNMSVLVAQR